MADRSSWFIDRRLDYIDWRLASHGTIRRADLMTTFGVSQVQASIDLNAFISAYPAAMTYDRSARQYVAAASRYRPVRGAPAGVSWD